MVKDMNFISLKTLKSTVDMIGKLRDTEITFVGLSLAKDGFLSFTLPIGKPHGLSAQIKLPMESRCLKERYPKEKLIKISPEVLTKITATLPTLLEEVSLEFVETKYSNYVLIKGEYDAPHGLSLNKGVLNNTYTFEYVLYDLRGDIVDFHFSEELQSCFKTSTEIAEVLKQAEGVTSKTKPSQSFTHINITCESKFGEITVKATDGQRIFQKRIYALEGFESSVDFLVAPQLGRALGKLTFNEANWQVYQNFVKVVLDTDIEVFAARSVSEIIDVSRYDDRSKHVALVVNPHELKSRLLKIKKDVTLHLYTQETDLLAIEYREAYGDGVAISWVKTKEQKQSAYLRINVGLLMQVLKSIKKTTKEILLRLPRFEANVKDDGIPTGFVEFAGNSYLICGVQAIGQLPVGVRDWLISQGEPIIPESQPSSIKARSVAEILNSRWNGKDWERPELVNCDCGSTCDSARIERKNAFKLYERCPYCGQDSDLTLERIDYTCKKCDVNNTSTEYTPIVEPHCMNCGGVDFDTTHTFYCCDCSTRVDKENLKVCNCNSELTEEFSWYCNECQENFQEDELSCEAIEAHAETDQTDGAVLGFRSCPCCESADSAVEPHITYHCETCESSSYGFHIPVMTAPLIECPECEKDISELSPKIPVDVFVVGSVTRF